MSAKEKFLESIRAGNVRDVRNWLKHGGVQRLNQFDSGDYSLDYPMDVAIETCGKNGLSDVFIFSAK